MSTAELSTSVPTDEPEGVRLGARQLVEFLEAHELRHVFGLPGSSAVGFFNALQGASVQYVQAVHESVAVAMADGYARVAGSACTILYMLPGTANGLANIYNAWRDETPLVVLTSQQRSDIRNGSATTCEADVVPVVAPFTRLAREVPGGASLRWWLELAFRSAAGPPSGPAFLAVPEDLLEHPGPCRSFRPEPSRVPPGAPDVSQVVDQLAMAQRPLLVVGGQVRRSGGVDALAALATEAGVPVVYEPGWNEALAIAPGHPNTAGPLGTALGRRLASEADVVVLVGCRHFREAHPIPEPWFPTATFVAHVNANADRLDELHVTDWSCACDPAAFLDAVLHGVRAQPADAALRAAREARLGEARATRSSGTDVPGPYATASRALSNALDHGWLVDESATAIGTLLACLRGDDGRRYMTTSGASLGWAPAASCGVALASGEPVTCILGDGSLFFGLQGMWTARAYDLPITFVIHDNGGYGSTRMFERMYVERLPEQAFRPGYIGSDFRGRGPQPAQVLEGFGIPSVQLDSDEQLRGAVVEAWSRPANGPQAIVVPIAS